MQAGGLFRLVGGLHVAWVGLQHQLHHMLILLRVTWSFVVSGAGVLL